jgi:hypothetical protein
LVSVGLEGGDNGFEGAGSFGKDLTARFTVADLDFISDTTAAPTPAADR